MSEAVPVKRRPGRPIGSGYPLGPQKGRLFDGALRIALNRVSMDDMGEAKKNFMIIAEKLIEEAKAGEPWAIKEVLDRIDGKPIPMNDVDPSERRLIKGISVVIVDHKPEDDPE